MNDYNENEEWGRYNYQPAQAPEPEPTYQAVQWGQRNPPHNVEGGWQTPEGYIPHNSGNQAGYQDISYWASKGVAPTEIFNANGQTNPGWSRTEAGYEKAYPAAPPPPAPPGPFPPGPNPPTPRPSGGEVPSIPAGGGIGVPTSYLPPDIKQLFNTPATKTPVQSAYQDALLKFMSRSQETPSLSDPMLGPQAEVYRVQQQRNQERNRRSNVERAAATGQNQSGYLDSMINQGVQDQRTNTAAYNANLIGNEMNKRRQELLAALQLASATGDQEAMRALQEKLAQVSAMMQQQGLNLQGQLGAGDLALRQQQTQMGNDQFYDQLGVNTALGIEGLNQRALQLLLGGLT